MLNLDIEITESCKKHLQTFYKNHSEGCDDNLYTDRPIHLVQTKVYTYIPYHEFINDYNDNWEICFIDTYWDNSVFTNEIDVVTEHYESIGEECDRIIMSFEEFKDKNLGCSFKKYFKYYNIDGIDVGCRMPEWETRAYFLIREEAVKYQQYQKHNLGESRIYTDSSGYRNYGEWKEFYDLLLNIGKELADANGN